MSNLEQMRKYCRHFLDTDGTRVLISLFAYINSANKRFNNKPATSFPSKVEGSKGPKPTMPFNRYHHSHSTLSLRCMYAIISKNRINKKTQKNDGQEGVCIRDTDSC